MKQNYKTKYYTLLKEFALLERMYNNRSKQYYKILDKYNKLLRNHPDADFVAQIRGD